MTCADVQRALLEDHVGVASSSVSAPAITHLATCARCARFAAHQQLLDAQLAASLARPVLSASFRSTLQVRLDQPLKYEGTDALPDLLHLGSCAVATALCTFVFPLHVSIVATIGIAGTVLTYVLLVAARNSLDESTL